jgi:hypothetical protein
MKGILSKSNRGWVVKETIGEGPEARLIKTFPLHQSDIDKLEPSVLGEYGEVEFEIIDEFTHPQYYESVGWGDGVKYAKLKQNMNNERRIIKVQVPKEIWDVDISVWNALFMRKDFVGIWMKSVEEVVEKDSKLIQLQQELIDVLYTQMVDLSLMSKIELGDDVIAEIRRLKMLINETRG